MANQDLEQITNTWRNISNLNIASTIDGGNFRPWNNMDKDDYLNAFNDLKDLMDTAVEQNSLTDYPWNILNSLQSILNTVFQQIQQFVSNPNQSTFQNSFSQLESLRTNLRSWGIYSFVRFGHNIDNKIKSYDVEYQKIVGKSIKIEQLKESVENLIQPAVAGSLSKSFSDRRSKLATNKKTWLWAAIATGVAASVVTILVVTKLIDILTLDIPESANEAQIQAILNGQPSNTVIQFLRIAILFPFYYLFGVSFSQYRQERSLEEEYAHRSAVSTSLPNYGDLAGDVSVKDQIISSATQVIFTTPIDKKSKIIPKEHSNLSELKNLFDSIGNTIQPKE